MTRRVHVVAAGGLPALALLALAVWLALAGRSELPADLTGAIVFVSDRNGASALYWRRLPRERERRLSFGSEPASEPAVSPDGTRVRSR